jgi:hypothetical protein
MQSTKKLQILEIRQPYKRISFIFVGMEDDRPHGPRNVESWRDSMPSSGVWEYNDAIKNFARDISTAFEEKETNPDLFSSYDDNDFIPRNASYFERTYHIDAETVINDIHRETLKNLCGSKEKKTFKQVNNINDEKEKELLAQPDSFDNPQPEEGPINSEHISTLERICNFILTSPRIVASPTLYF